MENKYEYPEFHKRSFHCPFCRVYAQHHWKILQYVPHENQFQLDNTFGHTSWCNYCGEHAFWVLNEKDEYNMIYPRQISLPDPHTDMPQLTKELYDEARLIYNDSPRAAAALLRCSLERLTVNLGEKKGTLNTRIGNLTKKGLSADVQKALDAVRITGNEGSHYGEIDLTGKDGMETVDGLFYLLNFIVEELIKRPKFVKNFFDKIPKKKRDGVKNRDSKNKNT